MTMIPLTTETQPQREKRISEAAAARAAMPKLKFFYNGIKDADGKLQRVWYSNAKLLNEPDGTITIYARTHKPLSATVNAAFKVENDSDLMTDYFEKDRIRVRPTHPLYPEVAAALELVRLRNEKRAARGAA